MIALIGNVFLFDCADVVVPLITCVFAGHGGVWRTLIIEILVASGFFSLRYLALRNLCWWPLHWWDGLLIFSVQIHLKTRESRHGGRFCSGLM